MLLTLLDAWFGVHTTQVPFRGCSGVCCQQQQQDGSRPQQSVHVPPRHSDQRVHGGTLSGGGGGGGDACGCCYSRITWWSPHKQHSFVVKVFLHPSWPSWPSFRQHVRSVSESTGMLGFGRNYTDVSTKLPASAPVCKEHRQYVLFYTRAVQLCSIGCVSDCVQLMRWLLVLSRDGVAVRVSTWVSTHVCQNLVGLLRQRLEDAQAILATLQDASNGRLHVLVRSLPVWSCLVPPSLSAWLSVCVAVCGCVYVSAQRKQQEKLDEMVDATLRTAAGVVGSTTEMLRSNQAKLHGVLDSMTVRGGIMNHAWR